MVEACGSAEIGVHLAARAVASAFRAATGAPLPSWAERGALEKAAWGEPVRFGGQAVDSRLPTGPPLGRGDGGCPEVLAA